MKVVALLVVMLLGLALTGGVWASDAVGAAEIKMFHLIFNGNLGFALGLVVVVAGLFAIIKEDMQGGLWLVALGVLITLTPGVYNASYNLFCPMVSAFTGNSASCK